MKQYNLTLSVPDDFDPGQLDLNVSYPEPDSILLRSEGFIDPLTIVKEAVDQTSISSENIQKSNVVIFKFPKEMMEDPFAVEGMRAMLEEKFGCTVIGLINDIDLMVQNSGEAINMLKQMIDKINAKSIIKLV